MEAHEFIQGHELVVARLGVWPSFHDAEVLKLVVDRTPSATSGDLPPVLDLHLQGWVLTQELDEQGRYKLHGNAVFHFRFDGVTDLLIQGFNNQNVLSAMNLSVASHPDDPHRQVLHVELEHCYEFQASFAAKRARVVSITPYTQ